jgi:hypothetical protein
MRHPPHTEMHTRDRFIRRVFALGRGYPLRRGEERRFRVVWIDDDGIPVVRVLDEPDRLPVFELRAFGFVATRRDQFPEGFDEANIDRVVRAAERLRQGQ